MKRDLTIGEWMNVANQNALEREQWADLAMFYLQALEDIAEPMIRIQAEAKAEGARVNGLMANELCKDANWLRDKAKEAVRRDVGQTDLLSSRVPTVKRATGRTIPDLTKREHVCEYQAAIRLGGDTTEPR